MELQKKLPEPPADGSGVMDPQAAGLIHATPRHLPTASSTESPLSPAHAPDSWQHAPTANCPSCQKKSCLSLAFNLLPSNFVDCLFFSCRRKKGVSDLPFLERSETRTALSCCLSVVIFSKANSRLSSTSLKGKGFSMFLIKLFLKFPINKRSVR